MVRRCAGSSQRRMSATAEPIGSSGSRSSRRRSSVIQPSSYELPEHSTSPINLNRRSSVVDLNRRTSVASNSSSTDLDQITDKEMERLLTLYNSRKIEFNPMTMSVREEKLKSVNSKGSDSVTLMILLVLGILAILAYVICS
ncbi:uncharacterized protein LOC134826431 [Bolinopsis microptera]|uniref:uncharacterized protein LOC134826431 n=1 Tax=Bolinopsis microptera TaxID=2820187 RepID=UPI00307A196F